MKSRYMTKKDVERYRQDYERALARDALKYAGEGRYIYPTPKADAVRNRHK